MVVCPTEHPASGVLTSGTDLTTDASDDNRPPQECELSYLKWHFLVHSRTTKNVRPLFLFYRNQDSQISQILSSFKTTVCSSSSCC